jgi:hypothetical protein
MGEKVLPHLKENESNLKSIKSKGTEQWMKEQKEYWSCPDCGKDCSWYSLSCSNCKRSLKGKPTSLAGSIHFSLNWVSSMEPKNNHTLYN